MIRRRGFTLWEMAIVLAIMGVAAALVVPAFARLGTEQPSHTGDQIVKILHDARATAIERNLTVALRVDPLTLHYRADTSSRYGAGTLVEGTLDFGSTETLVSDLPRLVYVFQPNGAARADSVLVRGPGGAALVTVDPWSGVASAVAR